MHDEFSPGYPHPSPLSLLRGRASLSQRFNRAAHAPQPAVPVEQLDLAFPDRPSVEPRADDIDITE